MFSPATAGANRSPIAANDSGLNGTQGSILTIPVATLLANDSDPDGDVLSVTGVSNSSHGVATFNPQTNTITFTPDAGYNGSASFDYAISDGRGGTATATASLSINPASSSTVSLFNANYPAMTSVTDPNSVELGMRFRASNDGQITGIRFYKSAQDVGTHVGNLWSGSGTLLATATFTNETTSGWQQVNFHHLSRSTPIRHTSLHIAAQETTRPIPGSSTIPLRMDADGSVIVVSWGERRVRLWRLEPVPDQLVQFNELWRRRPIPHAARCVTREREDC